MAAKDGKPMVVIKKEEVVEGGHHGGAWKVAYADFVTAMMAFFLLMWLLNATTEAQRRGIADYFSPVASPSTNPSGFGKPFGGRTPNSEGALASDRGMIQVSRQERAIHNLAQDANDPDDEATAPAPPRPRPDADPAGGGPSSQDGSPGAAGEGPGGQGWTSQTAMGQAAIDPPQAPGKSLRAGDHANPPTAAQVRAPTDKDLQARLDRQERAAFKQAAQQIRDAIRADPSLADLAPQLRIDLTPEGLRVQLVDQDRDPMFATGSAVLNERARAVLDKVAPILMRLPEPISIAGHTDSQQYKGSERSNWDLSADRANATRRLLVEAGVPESRIRSVAGLADRDPLMPGDPAAAANRRIAITVLHERMVLPIPPPAAAPAAASAAAPAAAPARTP